MPFPDVFGLKGIAIASGLSLAVGTFGGGWIVHKIWWGKSQADKLEISEASLKSTQKALADSADLLAKAANRAETEAQARAEAERRLSNAYVDNAALAASRASKTTHIIEKGDQLGQSLKTDYPFIYQPWPDKLWDYAFGGRAAEELPSAPTRGYPDAEQSLIP